MKREKGFTLVEVIVVIVIVAALALLAVQLYYGYVVDTRRNTAESIAASAAGFLTTAVNLDYDINTFPSLNGEGEWSITLPSKGNTVIMKCPAGVIISIDANAKTVKASIKGTESAEYTYQNH